MSHCPLCERTELCKKDSYPYLIHEFKHSYFVLGEHQFFQGYSLILSKHHHKEMTDLPIETSKELFEEMMIAHKALENTFNPDKMNMCSLGNVVPHIHWHFFPRYKSDSEFKNPPWLRMHLFDSAKIAPDEAKSHIEKIKSSLKLLGIS